MNFKTYTKSNKLKKRIRNDSSRILIFRDTHEPIVERSVFDAVQKRFEGRKRPDRTGELDMLAGYLYCGDCGKRMYLHRTYKKKASNNFYQCGGYQSHTTDCSIHYIRQNVIEEIILSNLRRLTSFARSEPEQFYEMALKRGKTEAAKIQKGAVKQQADIEVRLKQLDSIIRCLYEDRVVGRITPERYDEMVVGYEKEMAELKQKQTELKNNLSLYSQQQHAIQDFIDKAKAYAEMPKLTVELLHTFIQRVDVYKKIDKNSRKTENPIMIYYKFQITKPEQLAVMFGLEEDDFSKADNPEPAELDFTA